MDRIKAWFAAKPPLAGLAAGSVTWLVLLLAFNALDWVIFHRRATESAAAGSLATAIVVCAGVWRWAATYHRTDS